MLLSKGSAEFEVVQHVRAPVDALGQTDSLLDMQFSCPFGKGGDASVSLSTMWSSSSSDNDDPSLGSESHVAVNAIKVHFPRWEPKPPYLAHSSQEEMRVRMHEADALVLSQRLAPSLYRGQTSFGEIEGGAEVAAIKVCTISFFLFDCRF